MRVFVAGATGVVGRHLVPMLVREGHAVIAMTRRPERVELLRRMGAEPTVVDAFDAPALIDAVVSHTPDVLIHQLTDLSAGFGPEQLRANSRLRVVGTRNLVDAAVAAGSGRIVAQSVAWLYAPGTEPYAESHPLKDPARYPDDLVLHGILELERLVTTTPEIVGIVLRYGYFYGPGTGRRAASRPPMVDVADAARAAAIAVTHGAAGIYNIVDDDATFSSELARGVLGWRPSEPA